MVNVGDMVMVREPWIRQEHHAAAAKVIEIKTDPVLHSKEYLLLFDSGQMQWFNQYEVKTE